MAARGYSRRQAAIGAMALAAALVTACSGPPGKANLTLDPAARTRVEGGTAWGDGWLIAQPGSHVADMGVIPPDGVLRLSLLQDKEKQATVSATVYAGTRRAAKLTSEGTGWSWRRLEMGEYADGATRCLIAFRCAGPFSVGACEWTVSRPETPNILIFLIDTLRLDHVSCYGYHRPTTPHIDALAEESILFTQLMPTSSWTRPSVASLLTGTHPDTHGAVESVAPVRDNLPRLALTLGAAGYETHGYVSNTSVLPWMNIGTEFNAYTDVNSEEWQQADDALLADQIVHVLPDLRGRPWFLYVHAMGPHAPYDPPGGFASAFMSGQAGASADNASHQRSRDLYDGEIAYTDMQFGRVVEALKNSGLYDNTIIVVTSDHGEEFWEHGGFDHGKTLYEEQLRVPLIVRLPGARHAGARRDALVSMVDVAPTLLELVGAPLDPRFEGRSVAQYIETNDIEGRIGYASLRLHNAYHLTSKTPSLKCLDLASEGRVLWFDLERDPQEQQPLGEAPSQGTLLAQEIQTRRGHSQAGLHFVFTKEKGASRKLVCALTEKSIARYGLYFPYERGGEMHNGETGDLLLVAYLRDIEDPDARRVWEESGVPDVAHGYVELDANASPIVTVSVDGTLIDPNDVHAGPDGHSMVLDHTRVDLRSITGRPSQLSEGALPDKLGVYMWYQPPIHALPEDAMTNEQREALEGHGYL